MAENITHTSSSSIQTLTWPSAPAVTKCSPLGEKRIQLTNLLWSFSDHWVDGGEDNRWMLSIKKDFSVTYIYTHICLSSLQIKADQAVRLKTPTLQWPLQELQQSRAAFGKQLLLPLLDSILHLTSGVTEAVSNCCTCSLICKTNYGCFSSSKRKLLFIYLKKIKSKTKQCKTHLPSAPRTFEAYTHTL